MTKAEILTERQFLDVEDIRTAFDCGRSKAQSIIREIKSVSDIAKIKGKVTVTDYEKWFNGTKEVSLCGENVRSAKRI